MSTLPLLALFVYSVNVSLVPVDYLVHHKINLVSSICSDNFKPVSMCCICRDRKRKRKKKEETPDIETLWDANAATNSISALSHISIITRT